MIMTIRWRQFALPALFLSVGFFFFAGLSQWMSSAWKFNFFNPSGDVYTYWKESLTWGLPFHPHHPPGYPWLIAAWHAVAGAWLGPLAIMQTFTLLFLMGGALLMIPLCRQVGIAKRGWAMAFLYIAWPFVGSLYAVFPQIDAIVLFLLILGVLLAMRSRWVASGAVLGVATMMHPVAWIFAPLLLLVPWAVWVRQKNRPPSTPRDIDAKQLLAMTALAIAPMVLLWIWQTVVTKDPLWTIASIVHAQVASQGSLPILDGWIGTLMGRGFSGLAKVGILSLVVLTAVYILVRVSTDRTAPGNMRDWYRKIFSILIPAVVLGMAVVLNQHEIWAVMRFSKILIMPLILYRDRLFGFVPPRFRMPVLCALIGFGFLTQIAYAWYMANVFFSA
jgi:hypothetical protein